MNILATKITTTKSGFTLVELSIVLVIIGLLIGGILVGQSLIESAKLNRVIKELQQYEIGVAQFKTKYKYLPGDHPQGNTFNSLCTNVTCNGNGDGKIYLQVLPANNLEVRNVWYHLQGTGFLNLKLPFTTTGNQVSSTYKAGDNFPESTYADGIRIDVGTIHSSYGIFLNSATTASVDKVAVYLSGSVGGFMKPANAMTIDQKIDDGRPASGLFFGGQAGIDNCLEWGSVAGNKYDIGYNKDADGCLIALVMTNL